MLKQTAVFWIVLVFTVIVIFNKQAFIKEHLANQKPTLDSLQKEIDTTQKKLATLTADFNAMKSQAQSQASVAAAAKAQLESIH